MKEQTRQLKRIFQHIGVKALVTALAVFALAAGIVAGAGIRLYGTEKKVLQQRGELNAKASAMEYNHYLLTRVNIVTMVGCIVDDKLAAGADSAEIERYLAEETEIVIAALDPDTTGLYGWIDGAYLDGSGWTPDADYVPTERPWYTQTLRSHQKITFVEPYLDAQTNTIMTTVSMLLGDGRSVLAMDVSLDPIQRIVGQIASSTEGSQAFVLDADGVAAAHSDASQLGRHYLDEPETLGGIVARRLFTDGQRQFDLKTPDGNYSYPDQQKGRLKAPRTAGFGGSGREDRGALRLTAQAGCGIL